MPEVIAEAMAQPASEVCLDIISYRDAHKAKGLVHLPVHVKVFEDTFEILVNAIHRLNFERKRGLSMQQFKIKVEDCSIARPGPIRHVNRWDKFSFLKK